MKKYLASVLLLLVVSGHAAGCAENVRSDGKVPKRNPSVKWQKTLDTVATRRGVRYDLLRKEPTTLNQYVKWMGEHGQHSNGWGESKEDKRIAHLLNSHNAAVLHNAMRLDLPASPDDVSVGLYRWSKAGFYWGSRYRFDGEWSAIQHIALHDTVNRYQDPLLWIGLYDGTKDSPRLRFYTAKNLKVELKKAATAFINSKSGMKRTKTGWAANPLFFRYEKDFLFWSKAEHLCEWMAKFARGKRLEWLNTQTEECALEQRKPNRKLDIAPPPKPKRGKKKRESKPREQQ